MPFGSTPLKPKPLERERPCRPLLRSVPYHDLDREVAALLREVLDLLREVLDLLREVADLLREVVDLHR